MKRVQVAACVLSLIIGSAPAVCLWPQDVSAQEKEQTDEKDKKEKDQVATADEMATPKEVVDDSMTPVKAEELKDGEYTVTVDSSSAMFRIVDCTLTVKDGKMTAVMTMGGKGYLKLFMGTGEEAVDASEEDFIPFVENKDGAHTFEVPVEALDQGIACAAFSKNKEKWYDRTIVFKASSLPDEAFAQSRMTELELEDGEYTVEVTLSGGSGRASVESPAALTVKDGEITAHLIWSSPNYDYMVVDEEKYELLDTEGNSDFEIPVKGFDYEMPVLADTIAMSEPHEIEYTLNFDSASVKEADK